METQVKKTFTLQELANQYEVSLKTIYVWLKPIRKQLLEMNPGCKQRLRILLPKQVKLIQEFLG
jgi:transposase